MAVPAFLSGKGRHCCPEGSQQICSVKVTGYLFWLCSSEMLYSLPFRKSKLSLKDNHYTPASLSALFCFKERT